MGALWSDRQNCFHNVSQKINHIKCGFLRKSAVSRGVQMLEFPAQTVNLRKSAGFCEKLRFGFSLSSQFRPLIGNVPSATATTESLIWWIIRCYI